MSVGPSGDLLSPNLALGSRAGVRYPNQFFDLGQQYMPPTIKELFRWCTFYYYNSPLIGSAIKKVSRYPITDFIIEDEHDKVIEVWRRILVEELKLKERLMEVNLDYHVYGNAFVSIHLPFTRFLICKKCAWRQPIQQWNWTFNGGGYVFSGRCAGCGNTGEVDVKDVPHKDRKSIRLVRWNPENIHIKYNDYTGRYVYMYTVPPKLRTAIMRGDKDILEDIPLIVIDALRTRRMIRLNNDSLKHLKAPTLAEQDQGWGKPTIIHVLKDMYYMYTLRRAQEAIALEHIVPFDLIYPLPNAQQDPYVHTDLGNWKSRIEDLVERHRQDPNFKAIIPIPVGFGRLGGDGRALLLSPELNDLKQSIVGGMGLPIEFVFGGLSYTGSSISLRTLENDFIQNRTQLLDLVHWIRDKVRAWLDIPAPKSVRFADFRMADDVQRNQQLVGLNAQGKLSDQTLLAELGFDYNQEVKKRIEEVYVQNYINDLVSKGQSRSQGEAQVIQFNYQQKLQEQGMQAQAGAQQRMGAIQGMDPQQLPAGNQPQPGNGGQDPALEQAQPSGGGEEFQAGNGAQPGVLDQVQSKAIGWAKKLLAMDSNQARATIGELKAKLPDLGPLVEKAYNQLVAEQATGAVDMTPLPEQGAPRRGSVTGGS